MSVADFEHHHHAYIDEWNKMEQNWVNMFRMYRNSMLREYLSWYHGSTRYRLRLAWTQDVYADIGSSNDDYTAYENRTRKETQVEITSILDRVVRANSLSNIYYTSIVKTTVVVSCL